MTKGGPEHDHVTISEPTWLTGVCPPRPALKSTLLVPPYHPDTHQHGRVFLVTPGPFLDQVSPDAVVASTIAQQRGKSASLRPSRYTRHLWHRDNLRADIRSCTGIQQSTRSRIPKNLSNHLFACPMESGPYHQLLLRSELSLHWAHVP